MTCPVYTNPEVVTKFNSIIELFGGKPMTIEEFKDVELRNKRTGKDLSAMNIAYNTWDKYEGDVPNLFYQGLEGEYNDVVSPFEKMTKEQQVSFEKTIRDISVNMSDRIGINYRIINDKSQKYKGKIENGVAYVNLAYATLDTPIHEILGHPIIRGIKSSRYSTEQVPNGEWEIFDSNMNSSQETTGLLFKTKKEAEEYIKTKAKPKLYNNLLKELETGRGKEVLDRVKRNYNTKEKVDIISYGKEGNRIHSIKDKTFATLEEAKQYREEYLTYYTLEEQQEEAIVELLGLMTAGKLDKVKDKSLISYLKELLAEISKLIKGLLKQREIEVENLPDNLTLGDLSDLLAYSNSKIILPGFEVEYTTPDNTKHKTYSEASKHISNLVKSVKDVDLSNVSLLKDQPKYKIGDYFGQYEKGFKALDGSTIIETQEQADYLNSEEYRSQEPTTIKDFIEKNKEFEQSKEIIEEWKKVNNIQYNPEEVYSRGQGFYSLVGAYSDLDVRLLFQNLLTHLEDHKKVGAEFTISAFTDLVGEKKLSNIFKKNNGSSIVFKIFPQPEHIKWAATKDVMSGSVTDAPGKINKDKAPEILGVSYTKAPSLYNINPETIKPNLAEIIDNIAHVHNELGIQLTGNNFRLEYQDDVPNDIKKLINSLNSILDEKFGKLVEPKIEKNIKLNKLPFGYNYEVYQNNDGSWGITQNNSILSKSDEYFEPYSFENKQNAINFIKNNQNKVGIQPTQTNETLEESIDSVNNRYNTITSKDYIIEEVTKDIFESNGGIKDAYFNKATELYIIPTENENIDYSFNITTNKYYKNTKKVKEYTQQALINTKLAALKEVAKKYPRSLIRNEVKPIGYEPNLFANEETPFQKIQSPEQLKEQIIDKILEDNTEDEEITIPPIKTDYTFPIPLIDKELIDKEKEDKTKVDLAKEKIQISKLDPFLQRMGFNVETTDRINDKNGNEIPATAKVDILAKTIELVNGRFTEDRLPEEAAHIYVTYMRGTPLYNLMMDKITGFETYNKVVEQYGNLQGYKGNEIKLKEEAIAHLIADNIINKLNTENESKTRTLTKWWEKVLEWFKSKLGSYSPTDVDPFYKSAEDILNPEDLELGIQEATEEDYFYNMSPEAKNAKEETVRVLREGAKIKYDATLKTYINGLGKRVKFRVTDLVKAFYAKIFRNPNMEETEGSKMQAKKGIYGHKTIELIFKDLIKGKTVNEILVNEYFSKNIIDVADDTLKAELPEFRGLSRDFFTYTEKQAEELVNGTNAIFDNIKKTTAMINKMAGTTGEAEIILEFMVYDEVEDRAGTIDVVVVYPNGAVATYDWKFINFKTNKGEISEGISATKEEAFDIQLSGYQRIFTKQYGIKNFAETRIVPINMQLNWDSTKQTYKEKGFYNLQMGEYNSKGEKREYLGQISVAREMTNNADLNRSLEKLYIVRDNLRSIVKSNYNDQEAKLRLNKINEAIKMLVVEQDSNYILDEVGRMYNSFYKRATIPMGEKGSLTYGSLVEYIEYADAYKEFAVNLSQDETFKGNQNDWSDEVKATYKRLQDFNFHVDKLKLEASKKIVEYLNHASDYGILDTAREIGFLGRLFTQLGQIDSPLFRKLSEIVTTNAEKTRNDINDYIEKTEAKIETLTTWAKSKGISLQDAYDKIYNSKTGNLIPQFTKEYFKERDKAFADKDTKWIKNHMKFNQEKYDINRTAYLEILDNRFDETQQSKKDKALKEWESRYNIINESAINANNHYLSLIDDKNYYSEEWAEMLKDENKSLKEFYDYVAESNKLFEEITGKRIDKNFLANIRQDTIDALGQTGLLAAVKGMKNFFQDMFEIRDVDYSNKEIDPTTKKPRPTLMLGYRERLRDNLDKTEIAKLKEEVAKEYTVGTTDYDVELEKRITNAEFQKGLSRKNRDIGKGLILFAKAVYTHKHAAESEDVVKSLQVLAKSQLQSTELTDQSGKKILDKIKQTAAKYIGLPTSDIETLDKFVSMYIYGNDLQGELLKPLEIGAKYDENGKLIAQGKSYSVNKIIQAVMSWNSITTIPLNPILIATDLIGKISNTFMFISEGIYFNNKQITSSFKKIASKDEKLYAADKFFEVSARNLTLEKANKNASTFMSRVLTSDNAYLGYKQGDDMIDMAILGAMLQNYGLDTNGKAKRLETLPKDTKSLYELSSIDDKKFVIKGLTDNQVNFTEFRHTIQTIATRIKGSIPEDNKSLINTMMVGRLVMQFRNWIPGMARTRFGEMRFDRDVQEWEVGRFRIVAAEMFKSDNFQTTLSNVGNLLLETALSMPGINLAKGKYSRYTKNYNKFAAKVYYEKFMSENNEKYTRKKINDDDKRIEFTIEDYIQLRQSKLKGFARELATYVSFASMLFLLSIIKPDDDDDKDYAIFYRNAFKLAKKSLNEVAFWFDPDSALNFFKSPIVALRTVTDIKKLALNTIDVAYDATFVRDEDYKAIWEKSRYDKKQAGYYSTNMLPGIRHILDLLNIFDKPVDRR
jgi:hypothetical protein